MNNNVENSSKWKGSKEIFKWKKDIDSLFLSRGVSSCVSKYLLDRISAFGSSIASVSFSMISWFWKFCFLVRALYFIFLLMLVSYNSSFEILENGISSKHFMQYQAYTHCWRYCYVDKLILLHLIWIQERHLSHWIAWWLFAAALLHILHGNLIIIELYVQ